MTGGRPRTIEFFFDPACPWTWLTSRWLVDATDGTDTDVQWRIMSLSVVNADRDVPEQYRARRDAARPAHRIIAAMRDSGRNDLVGDFYTEWGRRFHHDRAEPTPSLAGEVATAVGAEAWAGAAGEERWDAVIEDSTHEGQELAGGSDVGSPVLAFGEPRIGVFGPIVSPPPTGTEAKALLDHVVGAAAMPAFFELKRGRGAGPRLGPKPAAPAGSSSAGT